MSSNPRPSEIWIIDDASSVDTYGQILSVQFSLRVFESLEALTLAKGNPVLVIVDPPSLDPVATVGRLKDFPLVVSSKNDNLDFMRACLKGGARAVLLKPLRLADVLLTLEKALGTELLPNDVGGTSVLGLTFKERQLLASFLVRKKLLTRTELHEALWRGVSVHRKTLDVHLFNLRRKLHPLGFDIVCDGQTYGLQTRQTNEQEQFSAG